MSGSGRLWICLSCETQVAKSEAYVPENCPECDAQSFGRVKEGREHKYLDTGSDTDD